MSIFQARPFILARVIMTPTDPQTSAFLLLTSISKYETTWHLFTATLMDQRIRPSGLAIKVPNPDSLLQETEPFHPIASASDFRSGQLRQLQKDPESFCSAAI
jgi:hypothetical protein